MQLVPGEKLNELGHPPPPPPTPKSQVGILLLHSAGPAYFAVLAPTMEDG